MPLGRTDGSPEGRVDEAPPENPNDLAAALALVQPVAFAEVRRESRQVSVGMKLIDF